MKTRYMTRKVVYYTAWYNNAAFGSIGFSKITVDRQTNDQLAVDRLTDDHQGLTRQQLPQWLKWLTQELCPGHPKDCRWVAQEGICSIDFLAEPETHVLGPKKLGRMGCYGDLKISDVTRRYGWRLNMPSKHPIVVKIREATRCLATIKVGSAKSY